MFTIINKEINNATYISQAIMWILKFCGRIFSNKGKYFLNHLKWPKAGYKTYVIIIPILYINIYI